ncbi:hypothetical protein CDL12_13972 [Handroanthus impetiginosus]|uniref:Uncharacterized protein n=1 Tax=Handroanthus impetiginosus TaxID=429701 RepID=A0A2G9H7E6_9LAMI|nr:hypothetical protein CDL12_13972 [Handroanthus impetiginosus]
MLLFRQTASESETRYYTMPREIHETVMEMGGYSTVPLGDTTQTVSDSGISTVHSPDFSKLVKEKTLMS